MLLLLLLLLLLTAAAAAATTERRRQPEQHTGTVCRLYHVISRVKGAASDAGEVSREMVARQADKAVADSVLGGSAISEVYRMMIAQRGRAWSRMYTTVLWPGEDPANSAAFIIAHVLHIHFNTLYSLPRWGPR